MNRYNLYKSKSSGLIIIRNDITQIATALYSPTMKDWKSIGNYTNNYNMYNFVIIEEDIKILLKKKHISFRSNQSGDLLIQNNDMGIDNNVVIGKYRHSYYSHKDIITDKMYENFERFDGVPQMVFDIWTEPLESITFKKK